MSEPIVVVSGLPRSGTSLMMQMLAAGGLPVLTDQVRVADADNPGGYYEYEPVKRLANDPASLDSAPGKAVKVVSELLPTLPAHHQYKVLFMRRAMGEILASQRAMLARRGKAADPKLDNELATRFMKHLWQIESWLGQQDHIDTTFITYNELLREPGPVVADVHAFLGLPLDQAAMQGVIDPELYRQRLGKR